MSSGATNSFSRRTHFRVLGGSAHVMHIDCYCDRVQLDRTEKFRNLIARYRDILTLRRLTSYIYDISSLRVNDLTLILLTWRKW